jgi:hypothetical protein
MMILEWGGKPQYKTWPDQPVFRVFKLSQLLDEPEKHLRDKMHARVNIDLPLSFEEANFIKETFMKQFSLRELMLIPQKEEVGDNAFVGDITFESVDTIVVNQLTTIESDAFDKNLLLDIYHNL